MSKFNSDIIVRLNSRLEDIEASSEEEAEELMKEQIKDELKNILDNYSIESITFDTIEQEDEAEPDYIPEEDI